MQNQQQKRSEEEKRKPSQNTNKKHKLIHYIICFLLKTMSVDADGWEQTFPNDVLMPFSYDTVLEATSTQKKRRKKK